jgi:hypothetical protein
MDICLIVATRRWRSADLLDGRPCAAERSKAHLTRRPIHASTARTTGLGDDPKAETERLLAKGWTLVMAANAPEDGYGRFTYVQAPSGLLVEPVAAVNRPRFEAWWAGGTLAAPGTK